MSTIKSCPDKPNCVSSTAEDKSHNIEPLSFEGEASAAFERVRAVMKALPRTKLVGEEAGYLKYEVRTRIMRFVDDVEFGLNEERGVIDVRSASRVGYSDMGVNRKRVETIRSAFEIIQ